MRKVDRYVFYCIVAIIVYSCARPELPSGGPRDTIAPVIDTGYTTALIKTNFPVTGESREFILYFDEFVETKNIAQEVLVSPPMSQLPIIRARKKEVTITLPNDTLEENTTYIVNLGGSIVDLNEGNKVENLQLIFSTGDFIDSLEQKFSVIKWENNEPLDEVTVMLYKDLSDSVIYEKQPLYVGKTDKQGKVTISYLSPGTYQVYAIKDENRPFVFDGQDEFIGYSTELLVIPDTSEKVPTIAVFQEEKLNFVKNITKVPTGKHALLMNNPSQPYDYEYDEDVFQLAYIINDSLILWQYPNPELSSSVVYITHPDNRQDSAQIKLLTTIVEETGNIKIPDSTSVRYIPGDSVEFKLSAPITKIDTSKISITDSSGRQVTIPMKISLDNPTKLYIYPQKFIAAEIVFHPGALENISGNKNDTFYIKIEPFQKSQLSNVTVMLKGLDSMNNYIFNLKDSRKQGIVEKFIQGKDSLTFNLGYLLPDGYEAELIVDTNRNGRYDPPSLRNRTYGEERIVKSITEMKPNWDFELIIHADE